MSNFLIQATLQRVDAKASAENMVVSVADLASQLLASGRAGVLWRAAQACCRLGLKPKVQGKLLDAVASAVQEGHGGGKPGSGDAAAGSPRATTSSSDPFTAARAWVPALLAAKLPGEGGLTRLSLNVPGARIVQNALRFDPAVAAPVLKAVAALPETLLVALSRDNLGSRCLLDPVMEAAGDGGVGGGKRKNKAVEDALRTILRAFRGHLVSMACDRIAWHVLLKFFRAVDMKEKR